MEILVPVWPTESSPRVPKERLREFKGAAIAIVDDNLDAPFTAHLEETLKARTGADVRRWLKPTGTAPSPKDLVDEVASWADVALVGIAL